MSYMICFFPSSSSLKSCDLRLLARCVCLVLIWYLRLSPYGTHRFNESMHTSFCSQCTTYILLKVYLIWDTTRSINVPNDNEWLAYAQKGVYLGKNLIIEDIIIFFLLRYKSLSDFIISCISSWVTHIIHADESRNISYESCRTCVDINYSLKLTWANDVTASPLSEPNEKCL